MRTTMTIEESLYERARQWAGRDGVSINEWLVSAIDREDTRRRCEAHSAWLTEHPDIARALAQQALLARQHIAADAEPGAA